MNGGLGSRLFDRHLRALDFLIGEGVGPGILYPPGRPATQFTAHLRVEREHSERFIRMEFFAMIPGSGPELVHSLITYSGEHGCYRMWSYLQSAEEPMLMHGDFQGQKLVLISDPTQMRSGIQKLRCEFSPLGDEIIAYSAELWTIDGYIPYLQATYSNATMSIPE
jgi:hypothetical protein